MKVAVVHDYFTQLGGAEKVAEELYRMLPDPSLFATVAFPNCMPGQLKNVPVSTSWMQRLPGIERYYRLYFLLYPFAVSDIDLSGYDLILSSSSGYVKGVRTNRDAVHVCYCHTPMRWVWSFDSYSQRETFGIGQRTLLPMLIRALKLWDEGASRQPDHFVANSKVVADRIRRAYGRSAEVIHPPIDTRRFVPSGDAPEDYYLVLSRLVSYKRIDLAVRACTQLNKKLVVVGFGPDRHSLESIAGPTVSFLGRASDSDVEYLVSRCKALLFPGEEDFGMAPLEVAAAGRPTIAYRAGGAIETILENETGLFFDEQTPESLAAAIQLFERQSWDRDLLIDHAHKFGVHVFQDRFRSFLRRIGVPIDDDRSPLFHRNQPTHSEESVLAVHA
jgi:glycosyltransferase involved in cell wall biosynthesis